MVNQEGRAEEVPWPCLPESHIRYSGACVLGPLSKGPREAGEANGGCSSNLLAVFDLPNPRPLSCLPLLPGRSLGDLGTLDQKVGETPPALDLLAQPHRHEPGARPGEGRLVGVAVLWPPTPGLVTGRASGPPLHPMTISERVVGRRLAQDDEVEERHADEICRVAEPVCEALVLRVGWGLVRGAAGVGRALAEPAPHDAVPNYLAGNDRALST